MKSTTIKALKILIAAPIITAVAGCGVVAAPCRIVSAGLKMVPVVGCLRSGN